MDLIPSSQKVFFFNALVHSSMPQSILQCLSPQPQGNPSSQKHFQRKLMGNRFNSIFPKAYSKETIGKRDLIPSSQRSCQRLSPLFSASVHFLVPLFVSKMSEITHCVVEFNASVYYSVPQPIFQRLSLLFSASVHLTVPHTSLLTPHPSHLPPHTSHVAHHTTQHTPHTSHLTPQTSTSHLRPQTSDLGPATSDLIPQTSVHTSPSFSASVYFSVSLSIIQWLSSFINASVNLFSTTIRISQHQSMFQCVGSFFSASIHDSMPLSFFV